SQRFSDKPMNVEFVLLTDTSRPASRSTESYVDEILELEGSVIASHAETTSLETEQGVLF
ncbi:MAG: hypothetical protein M3R43_09095, partial [Acidobacteriota bacterium]|nr:hypothetical protein [Acidobacteriota bacterium]